MDFIIFPFHDFKKWIAEGFRTRDAHIVLNLNENKKVNKILVVNRPVSKLEEKIRKKEWKTEFGRNIEVIIENKDWRLIKYDRKVYCLDIFSNDVFDVVLNGKYWWSKIFEKKDVLEKINEAIMMLELEKKIILLQNPMAINVLNKFNSEMSIFDTIDNWLEHPQNKKYKKKLERNYKFIDEKADIILSVSEKNENLYKNKGKFHHISNGVDLKLFKKSTSIFNPNKKIKIGYVGKIQERIDFELVERCAQTFNDIEFRFIGPILSGNNKVRKLEEKCNNIKFIGDIHYEKLPEELKKIDIAIIPHINNDFTKSMNPLKIYEYLAAGKQVISTKIEGVDKLSKYIYVSDDLNEFISNLDKSIKKLKGVENLAIKVQNSLMEENGWKYKVDKIIEIIESKVGI